MERALLRQFWKFLVLCGVILSVGNPQSAFALASVAQTVDICEIQGSGISTPYYGQSVETTGVVVLDLDTTSFMGFYIQDENCDTNPATSDGLFVSIGQNTNVVSLGDKVEVSGDALEDYGLTIVESSPGGVTPLGVQPLPDPVPFSPPALAAASKAYFESHEGMRITIADATVVGPTNSLQQTFVVDTALGIGRVFQGPYTGMIVPVDGDGVFEILPVVKVGDRVTGLVGALDYSYGQFRFQLTSQPLVIPLAAAETPAFFNITFATVNLHNLFDTVDDPLTADTVLTPGQYQTKLEKLARLISGDLGEPLFMAVQEAENGGVLQALANRPEISIQYLYEWIDGPDLRGIDVALLYHMDRVQVLSTEARQSCTTLIDGLGPDGNQDVLNPQNALTCDIDGQPGFDGNRLFSRPPLIVHLIACAADCDQGGETRDLWVISVHLKSKSEDTDTIQYTLPRRLEESQILVEIVQEIQAANPAAEIILLGDLNDFPGSLPINTITASGLVDLAAGLPAPDRYTYNWQGVSQILDHVFVSQTLLDDPDERLTPYSIHIGADYPYTLDDDPTTSLRASDHDPLLVYLALNQLFEKIFLPVIHQDP